jgi:hypothetical protein
MDTREEMIVSALNIPYLSLARNTHPMPNQKGTYEHLKFNAVQGSFAALQLKGNNSLGDPGDFSKSLKTR